MDNQQMKNNLYSRQIGALGLDTMQRLVKLKVLVINLKGTGVEIAKNLALAGPKKIGIFDDGLVEEVDLGVNFYLREE